MASGRGRTHVLLTGSPGGSKALSGNPNSCKLVTAYSEVAPNLFYVHLPGVGKTTLCRKAYEVLKDKGIKVQGFYTEEVRNSQKGSRVGFDVVTLDGQRGPLARTRGDGQTARARSSPSVGNYSVDIKSFEQLALPTIKLNLNKSKVTADGGTVVIVDEVGKMELFSQSFISSVRELFSLQQATILATVPLTKQRPILFVDELKNRKDVTLIEVTRSTRNELVSEIVQLLEESLVNK